MSNAPTTVAADARGRIRETLGLAAAGRSGWDVYPLDPAGLIPLPAGSRLLLLPGRAALGFDGRGRIERVGEGASAVAAFLAPGYTALSLAAFERQRGAPMLPLYSYGAVCWYRGQFHVPAVRVDPDRKHDPSGFDPRGVARQVKRLLKRYPGNRLVAHHGRVCALRYGCPNAANWFLRRWEAPVAVSGACNAACRGCISEQKGAAIPSPQDRIGFVPTEEEIVEMAVPHLDEAPRAMISFGQGCEGEPLLQGELIEAAIRAIRRRTRRGTIHLNTNGSRPDALVRLIRAGLDSVRISLNSAREPLYKAYYRCRGYGFGDVMESFRAAHEGGLWVSVNLLTFPGVTDSPEEAAALMGLLRRVKPDMIQWRNLNIDPDAYLEMAERAGEVGRGRSLGLLTLMQRIRRRFPGLRFGYFNPPKKRKVIR